MTIGIRALGSWWVMVSSKMSCVVRLGGGCLALLGRGRDGSQVGSAPLADLRDTPHGLLVEQILQEQAAQGGVFQRLLRAGVIAAARHAGEGLAEAFGDFLLRHLQSLTIGQLAQEEAAHQALTRLWFVFLLQRLASAGAGLQINLERGAFAL